jgi:two-component SAPR family response regulator
MTQKGNYANKEDFMYCKKCKERNEKMDKKFIGNKTGTCQKCGKTTESKGLFSELACKECSEKLGLCQECNNKI